MSNFWRYWEKDTTQTVVTRLTTTINANGYLQIGVSTTSINYYETN